MLIFGAASAPLAVTNDAAKTPKDKPLKRPETLRMPMSTSPCAADIGKNSFRLSKKWCADLKRMNIKCDLI